MGNFVLKTKFLPAVTQGFFFFPFESTALLQLSDYNRLKASESNGITPASQFTGQPHFGKFISLNVVLVR